MVAIDARAPLYDGGICTRIDCVSLGVVVNREARRFYDEGEDFWPKRYALWGRLVALQPGQIAYSIIDVKSVGRFMPAVFENIKADTLNCFLGCIFYLLWSYRSMFRAYRNSNSFNFLSLSVTFHSASDMRSIAFIY
jgi:hypothetical protein